MCNQYRSVTGSFAPTGHNEMKTRGLSPGFLSWKDRAAAQGGASLYPGYGLNRWTFDIGKQ